MDKKIEGLRYDVDQESCSQKPVAACFPESDEDQQILSQAAAKAQAKDRELIRSQTEEYIGKLEEEGMTVTHPDLAEFKEATSSAVQVFADTYDADLLEKIR